MPIMELPDLPEPYTEADARRVLRHQHLLGFWHGLSAEELLADQQLLTQLLLYTVFRDRPGAHDCRRWRDDDGACVLCTVVTGEERRR